MQELSNGTTLHNGDYRILQKIGQGGFGVTYVASRTSKGENVAIKELFIQGINERHGNSVIVSNSANNQLFSHQKEKFEKEARRIQNIKNEHVVRVYETFEENNTIYYSMELIEGYCIVQLLKSSPFPERDAFNIMDQILDALSSIHAESIWHLDIKPDNILLDHTGRAVLIDFGASKHIEIDGTLTTTSSLALTPGYAAPEQLQGDMTKFGPWTDFYALGATFYVMVTKNRPPSFSDIISEGSDAFVFNTNISKEIRNFIMWFMEPNRKDRPQCVEDIVGNNHVLEETLLDGDNREIIVDGHKAIDLGLSVLWATMDIGADSEMDFGETFLWGDPNGERTYKVRKSVFAKWTYGGPSCNKICGITQYDTAKNLWGVHWQMPSRNQFMELAQNCEWELLDYNIVKLTGPNGNHILLNSRRHWSGECLAGTMLPFAWTIMNDGITWKFPNIDSNSYVDYMYPIRPICIK